jgi:hypothetical protein
MFCAKHRRHATFAAVGLLSTVLIAVASNAIWSWIHDARVDESHEIRIAFPDAIVVTPEIQAQVERAVQDALVETKSRAGKSYGEELAVWARALLEPMTEGPIRRNLTARFLFMHTERLNPRQIDVDITYEWTYELPPGSKMSQVTLHQPVTLTPFGNKGSEIEPRKVLHVWLDGKPQELSFERVVDPGSRVGYSASTELTVRRGSITRVRYTYQRALSASGGYIAFWTRFPIRHLRVEACWNEMVIQTPVCLVMAPNVGGVVEPGEKTQTDGSTRTMTWDAAWVPTGCGFFLSW